MSHSALFADLGIPSDYGENPRRPSYTEARALVDVEVNIVGQMQQLAPPAADAWRRMKQAAALAGIPLLLVSGFRSIRQQTDLFRRKLAAGQSIAKILEVNAAPGFSEHHTGLAIDIATPGTRPLTIEFEQSAAFAWLEKHAEKFAFAMPYGKNNALGFAYEPWHWSQLGVAPTQRR